MRLVLLISLLCISYVMSSTAPTVDPVDGKPPAAPTNNNIVTPKPEVTPVYDGNVVTKNTVVSSDSSPSSPSSSCGAPNCKPTIVDEHLPNNPTKTVGGKKFIKPEIIGSKSNDCCAVSKKAKRGCVCKSNKKKSSKKKKSKKTGKRTFVAYNGSKKNKKVSAGVTKKNKKVAANVKNLNKKLKSKASSPRKRKNKRRKSKRRSSKKKSLKKIAAKIPKLKSKSKRKKSQKKKKAKKSAKKLKKKLKKSACKCKPKKPKKAKCSCNKKSRKRSSKRTYQPHIVPELKK